jgi:hypothetical protein
VKIIEPSGVEVGNSTLTVEPQTTIVQQAFIKWADSTLEQLVSVIDGTTQLNLNAMPFIPSKSSKDELEKKRNIAQMYSYYNYLLLESSRDELKKLDPKFREIRFDRDNPTEDLLLTLDTSI